MAIIRYRFDSDAKITQPFSNEAWPDGAYCPMGGENLAEKRTVSGAMVLWNECEGFCLYETERNGYDDSDFFMTVWDPVSKEPLTRIFATTRAWSGPSMASFVDATPEVREAYRLWKAEQEVHQELARRTFRAEELLKQRQRIRDIAILADVPVLRLRSFFKTEHRDHVEAAMALLSSKRLRNLFRVNMRNQLIGWLKDVSPPFPSPFSHKQWPYI